jgi:hypothetical protein
MRPLSLCSTPAHFSLNCLKAVDFALNGAEPLFLGACAGLPFAYPVLLPEPAQRRFHKQSCWIKQHRWHAAEEINILGSSAVRSRLCWSLLGNSEVSPRFENCGFTEETQNDEESGQGRRGGDPDAPAGWGQLDLRPTAWRHPGQHGWRRHSRPASAWVLWPWSTGPITFKRSRSR